MRLLRHIRISNLDLPRSILTLGVFDGIHLGHQALFREVVRDAKEAGGCSVVLTFHPHPLKVLAPGRAPRMILTLKDRIAMLRSLGVDVVAIQRFGPEFARLEAEDFVRQYLVGRLRVFRLWAGQDLRFGKDRRGRVEDLFRWGKELGFEVRVLDPIVDQGLRISSTWIRDLIERGEVDLVSKYLGRYHFVRGRVVRGHQRGKSLGFPTANVSSQTEVVPLDGIYATFVDVGGVRHSSVTSVGRNPTFGEGPRTIECYILDFDGDLYGRQVRLSFVKRIREEKNFASIDLLVKQIQSDVVNARQILSHMRGSELTGLGR